LENFILGPANNMQQKQPEKQHVSIPLPFQSQNIQKLIPLPTLVTDSSNVTHQNVVDAEIYSKKVKQAKTLLGQTGPTVQDVSEAHEYEHKVISNKIAPYQMQNAPLWFTTAMQNMQNSLQQNIQNMIQMYEVRSIQRLANRSAKVDYYILTPLNDNTGNAPLNFPQTLRDLKDLHEGAVNSLLQAYGQPLTGNNEERKQCLARYIGVNVYISPVHEESDEE
jgi:hypothetical protein